MTPESIRPYEGALQQASALDLVAADGRVVPLAIQRYLADADPADHTVLALAVPPVLDVGCGPGRIVHALASAGIAALGVDIAEVAVALTTDRGAPALMRSVFDRMPGEGRWPTVLVLDGNIGIGGDVAALLRRLTQLLAPGGRLVIEASTSAACSRRVAGTDEVLSVRFGRGDGLVGPEFAWAVVDRDALIRYATSVGLTAVERWSADGRDFVRFSRAFDTP
jgi:SAM-dependent methyltransferase